MGMTLAMAPGYLARSGLDAVACVDLRTGMVLAAWAADDWFREALELAVLAAPQLCAAPRLDVVGDDARAREAIVVSESSVQAYARSRRVADRVVVGVARGRANVALLLASVRSVADSLVD